MATAAHAVLARRACGVIGILMPSGSYFVLRGGSLVGVTDPNQGSVDPICV